MSGHAFSAAEFNPDFTIVSAGFDAARGDPLGCCDVRILLFQSLSFFFLRIYELINWTKSLAGMCNKLHKIAI